jgi:uncharacterized Zn-binding protein involved in type VI secretion
VGKPAAKQGDVVTATDTHLIQPPAPAGPFPAPHPFSGTLDTSLSPDVTIMGRAAVVVGSIATNVPHLPAGGSFVIPPLNRGQVAAGSATVTINGQPAARAGDVVTTCDDPGNMPVGTIQAAGTVTIGG